MSRLVIVWSIWTVLGGAGLVLAQDGPPLEPPANDSAPAHVPAPTPVIAPPVSARPEVRPLLAIPGVTVPTQRNTTTAKPKAVQSPGTAHPSDREPAKAPTNRVPIESTQAANSGLKIPLTLEPMDDEPLPNDKKSTVTSPRDRPVDWPAGVPPADERPPGASASNTRTESPATSRSMPTRSPSLFGRFLGPWTANSSRKDAEKPQSKARVDGDPRPDASADAANKRKIEGEIQDSLGDRLRSVEVRVNGRNVLIVAKASRFWQKRMLRRALETLPGLAGFRARVDILD